MQQSNRDSVLVLITSGRYHCPVARMSSMLAIVSKTGTALIIKICFVIESRIAAKNIVH